MRAPRAAVAAGVFLLVAAPLKGAPQVEADPHELYERARAHLVEGELKVSAATIARLRALITRRPEWDPEGVFEKRLLPPLQARLDRLVAAARKLDDFTDQALQGLRPPDLEKEISTVRDYTSWATTVIRRLREQRDAVVASALPDPEEQMILTHTESYRRTESLLQVDVLKRLSESAGEDILGLLGGDPQLESVLVRFRQLKRDLMQVSAERDQLRKDAVADRARTEAVLEALLAVVTDGAPVREPESGGPSAGVVDRFRLFLDNERQALAQRTAIPPSERDALVADVDRYRRYNAVLRAAGLGQDESARIEALSKQVSGLRVEGAGLATAPAGRAVPLLITAALTLATVLLGWLAVARGRQIKSRERSDMPTTRMGERDARNADAGSKAA